MSIWSRIRDALAALRQGESLAEVFERLRALKKNISEVVKDTTPYREQLKDAKTEQDKEHAIRMISVQRLAKSAWKNLDDVYAALFGKGK